MFRKFRSNLKSTAPDGWRICIIRARIFVTCIISTEDYSLLFSTDLFCFFTSLSSFTFAFSTVLYYVVLSRPLHSHFPQFCTLLFCLVYIPIFHSSVLCCSVSFTFPFSTVLYFVLLSRLHSHFPQFCTVLFWHSKDSQSERPVITQCWQVLVVYCLRA